MFPALESIFILRSLDVGVDAGLPPSLVLVLVSGRSPVLGDCCSQSVVFTIIDAGKLTFAQYRMTL